MSGPSAAERLENKDNQQRPGRRGKKETMDVLWWILIAAVWIAIAFWPARVAGRKGHSFFGYFVFSLFFFPAALIVAYLVEDRSGLAAA